MALTSDELRLLIVHRCFKMAGQCNSFYLNHHKGVIRGLLWALTGDDPGAMKNTQAAFTAAGIPFKFDGEMVEVDDDWWRTTHTALGLPIPEED